MTPGDDSPRGLLSLADALAELGMKRTGQPLGTAGRTGNTSAPQ